VSRHVRMGPKRLRLPAALLPHLSAKHGPVQTRQFIPQAARLPGGLCVLHLLRQHNTHNFSSGMTGPRPNFV
jgi:hypothetical protein